MTEKLDTKLFLVYVLKERVQKLRFFKLWWLCGAVHGADCGSVPSLTVSGADFRAVLGAELDFFPFLQC